MRFPVTLLWCVSLAGSCVGEADTAGDKPAPDAGPRVQDILTTEVALDLDTLTGAATVVVVPGEDGVTLDVSGLSVSRVTVDGVVVDAKGTDGTLSFHPEGAPDTVTIGVEYGFSARTPSTFDGWMPALGVSFVWPWFCGNLFPCDPSLEDGVTFQMDITGVEAGLTAVYPESTHGDGPAYMPAVAVGDYRELDLGVTSAGTELSAWYFAGQTGLDDATAGTAHLLASFDYFEQTYGPYAFGSRAGTVQVNWGNDSWGGMEHHPYVHVGMYDFADEEAQVHEAAHGWFGDGVRIACWEDFVLSEGTTTYITARALEGVGGPDVWSYYVDDFLIPLCEGRDVNTVVLPDTCGEIDFLHDDLWSLAPYMKGACFYEEVADLIGPDVVDEVISDFYVAHVGQAAEMEEMIDQLAARVDPADTATFDALVTDWLRTRACPEDYATRCRSHQR